SRKKLTIPPEMQLNDNALAERLASLNKPKCANKLIDEKLIKRLPDPDAESFLHLPLRYNNRTVGVLVIGHKDPAYFAPDTPTEFVSQMGESIAAALAKMMGLNK
ncbi:MAG: GAF domain-containing protein, partial [Neisseriaceae bacterium]|nr:GAF domain-containing protein [Neisseriaceae bacterium]